MTNVAAETDKANEEERRGSWGLVFLTLVAAFFLVATILPNFVRARAQGRGSPCKSNLKNLGTAMEMYSTDWQGKYPNSLSQLTPKYLKTIPECPAAGSITYKALTGPGTIYNTGTANGFNDYYFIYCAGENHVASSVPADYPQYDGISGLIER